MAEPTHEERPGIVPWVIGLQNDLAETKAENAELREIAQAFVPHPDQMSGWDDEDAPPEAVELLRMAGKFWGKPATAAEACDEQKFPSSTLYSSPPAASRLSEWVRETHHKAAEAAEGDD